MDRARFDAIARLLATTGSRRAALGALVSAAILGQGEDEILAKSKGKGNGKGRGGNNKRNRNKSRNDAGKGRGGDGDASAEETAVEVQAEAAPETDELSGRVQAENAAKKRRGGKGKGKGRGKNKNKGRQQQNTQTSSGAQQIGAEATTCCGTKSCAPPAYISDRRNCNFAGQTFTNLNARQTNAYKINGKGMTVSGGDWRSVSFEAACLQGAKFTNNVDLRSVNFKDACLVDADLTGAQADQSVNFYNAILCRTKLPAGVSWDPNRDCNRGTACCATCDDRNPCPSGQKCCNGRCVTGVCCSAADCPDQTCKSKTCTSSNQCRYTNQPNGQPGTNCATQCCNGTCCTGAAQCVSGTCQSCNAQTCANGCCSNGQCTTAPNDQACGFNGGTCTNCAASGKVCNAQGQCVCPANKPNLCQDGTCQECCNSGQCTNANAPICGANRTCVACTDGPLNSQQCANAGKGNLCCGGQCASGICCEDSQCQTTGNDCVNNQCKCGSGATCSAPTPFCCGTAPDGVCRECCSNAQCTDPSKPFCSGNGVCVQCLSADNCPAPPECKNRVCNPNGTCGTTDKQDGSSCPDGRCCSGICRVGGQCCVNGDCPAAEPICNQTTFQCDCTTNPDSCPADPALVCKERKCVSGNCATVNTANGQPGPNCTGPQQECQNGVCICVPKTCADFPGQCGQFSDGCSLTLNCTCSSGCCDTGSKTCKVGTTDPFCGRNGENCTDCVEPLTCGGGGTPGVCGCPNSTCNNVCCEIAGPCAFGNCPCATNAQCPDGLKCCSGQCLECCNPNQCPNEPQICFENECLDCIPLQGLCGSGICGENPAGSCCCEFGLGANCNNSGPTGVRVCDLGCMTNADCPTGTRCHDRACKIRCTTNADCPEGQRCRTVVGDDVCEAIVCQTNADCPPGKTCDVSTGACRA